MYFLYNEVGVTALFFESFIIALSMSNWSKSIISSFNHFSYFSANSCKFIFNLLYTFFGFSPITSSYICSNSFNEPPINVPIGPSGFPIITPSLAYCLLRPFFSQCSMLVYCQYLIFSSHFAFSSGVIANALRFFQYLIIRSFALCLSISLFL